MLVGRVVVTAVVAAVLSPAGAHGQQVDHGPSYAVYCHPDNVASNPIDVPPGGSPKGPLPPGLVERELSVDGVRTFVIDGGDRSKPAVVLVPGNAGSGRDFVPLLDALAPHARVISYDVPGFGHADKPRGFTYTLEGQTTFLERLLEQLEVREAIMGGHDLGASYALEWVVRHPDRTRAAFVSSGGMAPDYEWHDTAQVWRTPEFGEAFMSVLNRQMWSYGVNQGQPRPLPPEFVNRMYDDYDRMTRCAVLDTYRTANAPDTTGRRQAAALKPHDLPALVIWGRHDAFIGADYAEKQKLGFPRAEIHVFEQAGHWPFVDEPGRTAEAFAEFVKRVLAPRPTLRVAPRGWRAGARRVLVRVAASPAAQDVRVEVRRGTRRTVASARIAHLRGARDIALGLRTRLRPGLYRLRARAANAAAASRLVRIRATRRWRSAP